MKRYYLAYGSNLNVEQMQFRCPTARVIGTAVIENFELLFKGSKSGSYLTIEPKEGARVPVGVWAVEERDEASLDRYEGYPSFYYKKNLKVKVTGIRTGRESIEDAFVYIMHEDRSIGMPTGAYVRTCLDGYKAFGFDEAFLMEAYEKSRRELGYEE